MTYQIIFVLIALAMTAAAAGLFAWRLMAGRDNPEREWRRVEENVAALRYEYDRLKSLKAAGRLSETDFKDREHELALRVIDETASEGSGADRASKSLPGATAAVVFLVMAATSAGGYLYLGDFSSMDEKAIEQVKLTQAQAKAERGLAQTAVELEKAVQKDKDNLEAWEILAGQYNETGNLSQAQIAYENVVRLNPKDANAWAELADIRIALGDGQISAGVKEAAAKCLALDPYHQKGLMIGAAVAFDEGDYKQSAILFSRLRAQIPQGNEIYDALTEQMNMAVKMGGLGAVPKDPLPPKPETDMEKMMRMGQPMAPQAGQDGVGLNPMAGMKMQ